MLTYSSFNGGSGAGRAPRQRLAQIPRCPDSTAPPSPANASAPYHRDALQESTFCNAIAVQQYVAYMLLLVARHSMGQQDAEHALCQRQTLDCHALTWKPLFRVALFVSLTSSTRFTRHCARGCVTLHTKGYAYCSTVGSVIARVAVVLSVSGR